MSVRSRRRRWLGLALVGAGSGLTILLRSRFRVLQNIDVDPDMEAVIHRCLWIFDSPPRLERLGRAYLLRYQNAEGDARSTLRRIRRLLGPSSPEHVDDVRSWIRQRVELDFAEGRVASVEGWFLSESEAELCAAAVGRRTI